MSEQAWAVSVKRVRVVLGVLLAVSLGVMGMAPSAWKASEKIKALVAANPEVKVPWEWDVDVGIQLAALINAVVLTGLLLTVQWWLRPWVGGVRVERRRPMVRGVMWGLLGMVVLGVGMRVPLASKSLWWDELWVIRQSSHGSWKVDEKSEVEGAMRFSPTSWKRCAFYYQKPTNHVPMALLQKASLGVWRAVSGAPRTSFSDLAARVPALVLSGVTIFLVGWLLWVWGAGWVGALGGAALFAVHPMAIRYGVDARGYALVMPLVVSALLAGMRLVRLGGRDAVGWGWLAVNQCVWLWAFPHGVVDVLVMTVVLAVLLGLAQSNGRDQVAVWLRLVVAHVVSGLLFAQLFLPNLLQARRYAGNEGMGHVLDLTILKETIARIVTGVNWMEPTAGTKVGAGLPELVSMWGGSAVPVMLIVAAVGLVIWNAMQGCRRGERGTLWLLGFWVSGCVFAAVTLMVDTYYYSRFAVALVPVGVVGLALGMGWSGRWGKVVHGVVWVGLMLTGLRGDEVLLKRPIEPIRDVAEWLGREGGEGATVLGYGHGREALVVFVPKLVAVDDAGQIEAEVGVAKAAGRALFLVVGHQNFNRAMLPTGFAVFEDGKRFEEVARFVGIEAENGYWVYRLRE
jgi:hypothetical protein